MKTKRIECDKCINFIWPELTVNGMIKENAKCFLGNRVLFRVNINKGAYDCGWFRYCNDFKSK